MCVEYFHFRGERKETEGGATIDLRHQLETGKKLNNSHLIIISNTYYLRNPSSCKYAMCSALEL